jgi:hypothetical protein
MWCRRGRAVHHRLVACVVPQSALAKAFEACGR